MNALFFELRELFEALWNTYERVVRFAVIVIIGWPIFLAYTAFAGKTVPSILGLVPLLVGLILFLRAPAIWSLISLCEKPLQIIKNLLVILGLELAIGWYLSTVPVANDRSLVPPLLMAFFAMILLRIGAGDADMSSLAKTLAGFFGFVLVVSTAVFFFGGRDNVMEWGKVAFEAIAPTNHPCWRVIGLGVVIFAVGCIPHVPTKKFLYTLGTLVAIAGVVLAFFPPSWSEAKATPHTSLVNAGAIASAESVPECDPASREKDYSNEDVEEINIPLEECWSPWYTVPENWGTYTGQSNDWMCVQLAGNEPQCGGPNDSGNFNPEVNRTLRVRGKEGTTFTLSPFNQSAP